MKHSISLALWLLGAVGANAAVPDLNGGTWQVVNPPQTLRTTEGKPPPLLPEAKALYEKHLAARKAGDVSFDSTERCLPPGVPRILLMPGFSFEFIQRPEQIAIHYEWNRLLRLVDMNVPQPDPLGPSFLGQSVGRWEGDTLVIDSIEFNDSTLLDASGLPHSEALHLIERYTPSSDGRSMVLRLRIEDPKTFSAPWETSLRLTRNPKAKIREDVCLERKHIDWGKFEDAPGGSGKSPQ